MKRIIVFTGSFNPITKAHLEIMNMAIEKVSAHEGIFLIASNEYLVKKMIKNNNKSFIIPEEIRKEMIESITQGNNKLRFGGKEKEVTADTLNEVIKANKDCEVYLLIGADKLEKLYKWTRIDTIIDKVKFIVSSRDDYDINKLITENNWYSKHYNKFIFIKPSKDILYISSSKIRNLLLDCLDYKELMVKEVYETLNKYTIDDFQILDKEKIIKYYYLKYGKIYARKLVYQLNQKIFINWDEKLLGNKKKFLDSTKVYTKKFKTNNNNNYQTITSCVNDNCINVVKKLINEGYTPALLNLASNTSPGGGYHNGTNAQEESLCYSSTLSQSLYQYGDISQEHISKSKVENKYCAYPLDINYGGIYSPNVIFFRGTENEYYKLNDQIFSCAVITVASLSNITSNYYTDDERIYFNNGLLNDKGKEIETNKIRTIFRIASKNNHDSLVLGAFGCGVYNLNPIEISKIFYDVMNEKEFKRRFKKIIFAIKERQENENEIGAKGKFKPFYDLFNN